MVALLSHVVSLSLIFTNTFKVKSSSNMNYNVTVNNMTEWVNDNGLDFHPPRPRSFAYTFADFALEKPRPQLQRSPPST
jgi:hypothetical protein